VSLTINLKDILSPYNNKYFFKLVVQIKPDKSVNTPPSKQMISAKEI